MIMRIMMMMKNKKSNQFIKTLSTIPSLENKNNPIYNK